MLQGFNPEAFYGFFCFVLDAQIEQVVGQLRSNQELRRQIGHRFLRSSPNRFNAGQVTGHQPIAHGIAKSHVQVMTASRWRKLAQSEKQMLCHAVEDGISVQTGPFWVGVATRSWKAKIEGFGAAHGGRNMAFAFCVGSSVVDLSEESLKRCRNCDRGVLFVAISKHRFLMRGR